MTIPIASPGQLVRCINDRFCPEVWEWTNEIPRKGSVYTVFRVSHHAVDPNSGVPGPAYQLCELLSSLLGTKRMHFCATRFRPVETEDEDRARSKESDTLVAVGGHEACRDRLEHEPIHEGSEFRERPSP